MKHFLLALLFLTSCKLVWNEPLPTPTPQAPGPHAAGSVSQMEWSCEETDVNDSLVWVQCDFHNNSPFGQETCIKVTFNDNVTRQEVVESRRLCSGPLWAGGTYENYAAFFKEKRQTLAQACGPQLQNCYMTTKWVKND